MDENARELIKRAHAYEDASSDDSAILIEVYVSYWPNKE